jgi:hypothetical protein
VAVSLPASHIYTGSYRTQDYVTHNRKYVGTVGIISGPRRIEPQQKNFIHSRLVKIKVEVGRLVLQNTTFSITTNTNSALAPGSATISTWTAAERILQMYESPSCVLLCKYSVIRFICWSLGRRLNSYIEFEPQVWNGGYFTSVHRNVTSKQSKAVPLHAMVALGGRGDIAPTYSLPWH